MSGKIAIAQEGLTPGQWKILDKILYQVCQVNPDCITMLDDDPNNTPDVLIVIGEKMLNEICGYKGILKYAGTVQSYKGIPVIPVVSPGYLEHNPNYLRTFSEHIQKAYQLSMGIEQIEATNQFKIVKDLDMLEKVVQYCKQTGYCSFDFESTKLTDKATFDPDFLLTSLSISFQPGSAYVIPLFHDESPFIASIASVIPLFHDESPFIASIASVIFPLQEIFCNPCITKIGQNVKFDLHCLAWLGIIDLRGPYHCTMLMHQLIDETLPHSLDSMIGDYYPQFANYKSEMGKGWESASLQDLAKYNALDSDITLRLYWVFTDILLNDPDVYLMYRNLTAPATKTLFNMEEIGMHVDKTYLVESIRNVEKMITNQEKIMYDHPEVRRFNITKDEIAKDEYIKELQEKYNKLTEVVYKSKLARVNQLKRLVLIEDEIAKLKTGELSLPNYKINFNSPDQLKELLFSKIGFGFDLPKQNFKKLNADSTAGDNLDLIKDKSGFLEQLQACRQLKRVNSTYLSSILDKLDNNHNIHTSFNQHVTKTGRLSSNKPNLQNIITRTNFKMVEEAVGYVKKCFIPPEGYTLVSADYSQIELRIIAIYANEPTMLKIYQNNEDIHEMTAANSRGFTLEEFKKLKETDPKGYKKMRYEAKAENFGFVYGMSVQGFREYCRTDYSITISEREAEKRRELYFKKYPELLKYHRLYIEKAKKFKYVRTFFGRRVHLPDIDSINSIVRGHAERNAINSPIQGTAGEMTIFALSLLYNRLPPYVLIVNSIHDSVLFYVPDEAVENILPIIRDTMQNLPLQEYFGKSLENICIKVDFEQSIKSWGELTE